MIIKRKKTRLLGDKRKARIESISSHDSGPGWESSSSSESMESVKVFSMGYEKMTNEELEKIIEDRDSDIRDYLENLDKGRRYIIPGSSVIGASIGLAHGVNKYDRDSKKVARSLRIGTILGTTTGASMDAALRIKGEDYYRNKAKNAKEELNKRNENTKAKNVH